MKTYKIIVMMGGNMLTYYQTGDLGVGDGYYQFTDNKSGRLEVIACYPIKHSIITLENDKINLVI